MKFARNVHFQIKNGKEQEFAKLFETNVLPTMKKEPGFKESLTMVEGNRGIGISLWDDRKSADNYQTATYPRLLEKLTPVIEGTPRVETYQVVATTLGA